MLPAGPAAAVSPAWVPALPVTMLSLRRSWVPAAPSLAFPGSSLALAAPSSRLEEGLGGQTGLKRSSRTHGLGMRRGEQVRLAAVIEDPGAFRALTLY